MKKKLSQGEVAFGVNIQEASVQSIEILALLGFDYINIDCLHSPLSLESGARMIQTAELRGITPLVRIPQNVPEVILRYLDVGVMGIMIADMDNAQVAQRAVRAVKYPKKISTFFNKLSREFWIHKRWLAPLHFYRIPIRGPGVRVLSAGSIGWDNT
jgi:2-keto-3-deoxy-L-rhamnonate aldolase RhmA